MPFHGEKSNEVLNLKLAFDLSIKILKLINDSECTCI